MSARRICVAKIGGSLLASEGLPQRLTQWLAAEMTAHSDTHYVLVVGGGALVDVVRRLDEWHHLDAEAAHWICVELMDVTARVVATMLPQVPAEDDYQSLLLRCREPGATILRVSRFLRDVEPHAPGVRLPTDWSVTSDSIAARLAIVREAAELVLVKSQLPEASILSDVTKLASVGYVDSFLPALAAEAPPLRLTTLRTAPK